MLVFLQTKAKREREGKKTTKMREKKVRIKRTPHTHNSKQKKRVLFMMMKIDRNLDLENDRSSSDDMVRNPRLDQISKFLSDIKT
jgi:hypothetical protein